MKWSVDQDGSLYAMLGHPGLKLAVVLVHPYRTAPPLYHASVFGHINGPSFDDRVSAQRYAETQAYSALLGGLDHVGLVLVGPTLPAA